MVFKWILKRDRLAIYFRTGEKVAIPCLLPLNHNDTGFVRFFFWFFILDDV